MPHASRGSGATTTVPGRPAGAGRARLRQPPLPLVGYPAFADRFMPSNYTAQVLSATSPVVIVQLGPCGPCGPDDTDKALWQGRMERLRRWSLLGVPALWLLMHASNFARLIWGN